MADKQIAEKIKLLSKIEPRREWVVLTKNEILGKKYEFTAPAKNWNILDYIPVMGLKRQFAYAFLTMAFIVVGVFGFAQRTLPGDMLFSFRRITEQSQAALSGQDNLKAGFETATRRLQDLAQAVKSNRTGNIPSAISEVKLSIEEVTKKIANTTDSEEIKNIAEQVKQIGQDEVLANKLGSEELKETSDALYKALDEQMIKEIEKTTLTEEDQKILEESKVLFTEENYSQSLEKILSISE